MIIARSMTIALLQGICREVLLYQHHDEANYSHIEKKEVINTVSPA